MFDFSPSPEQERVLDRVRALMDELVYPNEVHSIPHRGLPRDVLRPLQARVKAEGLWAPHLPAEAGGLGMGNVTLGLMNEQLGRSPIAPRVFGTPAPDTGNMEILWLAGTPEQKRTYLEPLVADDLRSCIAMTEPEVSGSDPTLIRTTAVLEGGEWVINGHKWFISNANGAAFAIVMAVTDPDAHRTAGAQHDHRADRYARLRDRARGAASWASTARAGTASCASRTAECRARTCWASAGDGFKIAQQRLGPGRITHCMRWIGVAQRAFELMWRAP